MENIDINYNEHCEYSMPDEKHFKIDFVPSCKKHNQKGSKKLRPVLSLLRLYHFHNRTFRYNYKK